MGPKGDDQSYFLRCRECGIKIECNRSSSGNCQKGGHFRYEERCWGLADLYVGPKLRPNLPLSKSFYCCNCFAFEETLNRKGDNPEVLDKDYFKYRCDSCANRLCGGGYAGNSGGERASAMSRKLGGGIPPETSETPLDTPHGNTSHAGARAEAEAKAREVAELEAAAVEEEAQRREHARAQAQLEAEDVAREMAALGLEAAEAKAEKEKESDATQEEEPSKSTVEEADRARAEAEGKARAQEHEQAADFLRAAEEGDGLGVKVVLEKPNLLCKKTQLGNYAAHLAAQAAHLECIRVLVQAGAHLDALNTEGETPLILAAKCMKNEAANCAKLLVESKADPEIETDQGWRALHWACNEGNMPVVQYLVEHAKVDVRAVSQYPGTALLVAINNQKGHVASYLIQQDPELLEIDDGDSGFPLHFAVIDPPLTDMVQMLLQQNADPLMVNADGKTALNVAESYSDRDPMLIELLRQAEADCQAKEAMAEAERAKTEAMRARAEQERVAGLIPRVTVRLGSRTLEDAIPEVALTPDKGKPIGKGAQGKVKAGTLKLTDETVLRVAIKMVSAEEDHEIAALYRELKILRAVGAHANVVTMYGSVFVEEECELWVVMELMELGSLSGMLHLFVTSKPGFQGEVPDGKAQTVLQVLQPGGAGADERQGEQKVAAAVAELEKVLGGTLPGETSALFNIAAPLCGALVFLHAKNIVHGDLKAANVLLRRDGTPHLADFGIASAVQSVASTVRSTMRLAGAGTPGWMAPEVMRGEAASKASDVYSFGMLLYELLTGHMPFHSSDPRAISGLVLGGERPNDLPRVSRQLDAVVRSAWTGDVCNRPSAIQLLQKIKLAAGYCPEQK